jgi:hypothetical protein
MRQEHRAGEKLFVDSCLEDIDRRSPRGLDKTLILQPGSGQ